MADKAEPKLTARAVLDWDGGHAEPGDDVTDTIPKESVEWLVTQGLVETEEETA